MPSPLELKAVGAYAYARTSGLEALRNLGANAGKYVGDAPMKALTEGAAKGQSDENVRTVKQVASRVQLGTGAKVAIAAALALVAVLIFRRLAR